MHRTMHPGHRFLSKGQIHYKEVVSDEDTDDETWEGVNPTLKLLVDGQATSGMGGL